MLATRLSLRLPVLRTFATTTARAAGITDVLKHDHRELEEYYEKIVSAADHDTKTRFQNQFTWELARHSLGEEIVVYPAFAKHVPGGQQMADKDRAQHQEVRPRVMCPPTHTLTHDS
jgi:hemerythrin superfamily protein